jgi:hypothetical protein
VRYALALCAALALSAALPLIGLLASISAALTPPVAAVAHALLDALPVICKPGVATVAIVALGVRA